MISVKKVLSSLLFDTMAYTEDRFETITVNAVKSILPPMGENIQPMDIVNALHVILNDRRHPDFKWLRCLFLPEDDFCKDTENVHFVNYELPMSSRTIIVATAGMLSPCTHGTMQLRQYIDIEHGGLAAITADILDRETINQKANNVPQAYLKKAKNHSELILLYNYHLDCVQDKVKITIPHGWRTLFRDTPTVYTTEANLGIMFARLCVINGVELVEDSDFRKTVAPILPRLPKVVQQIYAEITKLRFGTPKKAVEVPDICDDVPTVTVSMNKETLKFESKVTSSKTYDTMSILYDKIPEEFTNKTIKETTLQNQFANNAACCDGDDIRAKQLADKYEKLKYPVHYIPMATYSPVIKYEMLYAVQLVYNTANTPMCLLPYLTALRESIKAFPAGRPFMFRIPKPECVKEWLSHPEALNHEHTVNASPDLLVLDFDVNQQELLAKEPSLLLSRNIIGLNITQYFVDSLPADVIALPIWIPTKHDNVLPMSEIIQLVSCL